MSSPPLVFKYISFSLSLSPLPRSTASRNDFSWLQYNVFSEALGDRGKWDTARVVTIMLSAFHVSTWGLELSLDLAIRTDGPVDLMNRPPPVVSSGNPDDVSSSFDWIVQVSTTFHTAFAAHLSLLPSTKPKRSKKGVIQRGLWF